MGFPLGYPDLFLPKLLLHTLSFLTFFRKFISILLNFLGLGDFLEPEIMSSVHQEHPTLEHHHSIGATLIREMLPVVKVSDLIDPPESCAVCLYELDSNDDVRTLMNCRHVFHRSCVDRWLFHDQKTCPLCRAPFISEDLQGSFNERLWMATGFPDYYGDYSSITPVM